MKRITFFILLLSNLTINAQQTSVGSSDFHIIKNNIIHYASQIELADSLYKNYLPQSNFEEVEAAVKYLDSICSISSNHQRKLRRHLLDTSNFLHARAHYYHAVGLTEKDDIVGACEHYLRALEIMKGFRVSEIQDVEDESVEDKSKLRFMALTYSRLGELFLEEHYIEFALNNFKNALKYSEMLDDSFAEAITLKYIGKVYHISANSDSALYYYNKSIETTSHPINKLDVDKYIAQILFAEGIKDSAYAIINHNLAAMDNYAPRYTYYSVLGSFYYYDNEYDSAIYYLEKSVESQYLYTKLNAATKLSAIYDSLGNYEMKMYYDDVFSQMTIDNINKSIDKTKLSALYDDYKNREYETRRKSTIKTIALLIMIAAFILIVFLLIIRSKQRDKDVLLQSKIQEVDNMNVVMSQMEKDLLDVKYKYSLARGKIKSKNLELRKKDDEINKYKQKYQHVDDVLHDEPVFDLNKYFQSEICRKILNDIDVLSKSKVKNYQLRPLSQYELALLLDTANICFDDYLKKITLKYNLKNNDLYYLCLRYLNINDKQISSLLGLTYSAVRKKRNKMKDIVVDLVKLTM
ncbi:MAG: tetratricopeptide repeat protein [Lentimicrobiaceae bacterium]|nr:tetratricopeptide repeat protein [Lentimicrobiaceae bacterium]